MNTGKSGKATGEGKLPRVHLGYGQIKRDNEHMTSFTVGYHNDWTHAIVSGYSPKFGLCRADYYFENGKWILGAN